MFLRPPPASVRRALWSVLVLASPSLLSCVSGDVTTVTYELSVIDGRALSSQAMERRRATPQGCTFAVRTGDGGIHLRRLSQQQLPFVFPKLPDAKHGVPGVGRAVFFMVVSEEIPEPLIATCWVPSTTGVDELMGAQLGVMDWKPVYDKVVKGRYVSGRTLGQSMSRESREYAYEMLTRDPGQLAAFSSPGAGATRTQMPNCDYTYKGIMESGRATSSVTAGCHCDVWGVVEEFNIVQYYYSCDPAHPLAGMTTWASSDPALAMGGSLPLPDLNALDADMGDKLGCTTGCFYSEDVSGSLVASSYDGPGTEVHFTWQLNVPDGDVQSVQWHYESIDDEAGETSVQPCPTTADSHVCTTMVYSEGYMTVDFQISNNRSAYGEVNLRATIAPCLGNVPALDTLRLQYATSPGEPRTMPPCEVFDHFPVGSTGWPTWSLIQSHGSGALTSDWAIYRGILDAGLQSLHNGYGPMQTLSRVYSTPAKQDKVSAEQSPPAIVPNGRHIYGDAADIRTTEATWQAQFDAVVTYASALKWPCREPLSASKGFHVHMDYRTHIDAIRRYTANGGKCPLGYGQP